MAPLQIEVKTSQTKTAKGPIKLALVSGGLGNVNRGFETSTARWFDALRHHPKLKLRLFSGGKFPGSCLVWNIPRDWVLHSPLRIFKRFNERRFWEFCYGVEQISLGLFIWPDLVKFRPDVIWTKEVPFAYFLIWYRIVLGLKYKIIFANGGAFRPQTYQYFDFIQHLTHQSYEEALQFGIAPDKMTALTNCISYKDPPMSKADIRKELGFAPDDWVIICVAAWNRYHKRIDYLIEETAALNDARVKLVLCGHPESDTDYLRGVGSELLGDRVRWLTVPEIEVARLLKAADIFVLPSLEEALGNSLVEALLAGLPVITHAHASSKYVHNDPFWMCDLSQTGNLTRRLRFMREQGDLSSKVKETAALVREKFDEKFLVPRFYQLIENVHHCKQIKDGFDQGTAKA